ncbi:MAG TPA: hypothetical protein VEV41_01750 [Terriglobales bacterium]|nr:hypothetical protein [Terriglobales bacterium]
MIRITRTANLVRNGAAYDPEALGLRPAIRSGIAPARVRVSGGGSLIKRLSPPELSEKDNDLLAAAYAGRILDAVGAPPSWMRTQE